MDDRPVTPQNTPQPVRPSPYHEEPVEPFGLVHDWMAALKQKLLRLVRR